MVVRRAFRYWQFVAAFVLPAWLLVGWSIFSAGWELLILLIACPVLAVAMLIVAAIMSMRKRVRATRALSWADVGILTLWHLLIIVTGTYWGPTALFVVCAILVGVAAFWLAIWELVREARARLAEAIGYNPGLPQSGQTIRLE